LGKNLPEFYFFQLQKENAILMQYHEYQPKGPLGEFVQTIWSMESENLEETYPRSLIMPDGIIEVIFHYSDPFRYYKDNKSALLAENAAVSMMRKFIEIESSGNIGFVAVRFFPWGAYHFFDVPISSFLDDAINGEMLWKDDSKKIIAELKSADNLQKRYELAEGFLSSRLEQYKKAETKTDEAVKLIRQAKGNLSIEDVCDKTGLNKKQLERKFVKLVGTTPKVFSRVCRFLHICHHLDEQKGKSLTQLAYECGYYDQSHFINEFKEFSGFTPKDFFEKEHIWFTQV
jgi:AraC-like DNA-binding protein